MLPRPTSPEFPDALKAARESKDLNFTQLARLCSISPVMPSRYEDRQHSSFGPPSDKTWEKLNQVLFDTDPLTSTDSNKDKRLNEASIEELTQALKNRGAMTVTITL
ncbi:MAG: transcriptional regulator with XRE-family HTH domain [Paraglaciecola sp.]|jgi:transcriptional regulator with XRE-family HTH domain|tara:strand:- start:52 stop:372 length:321 start_codon:yes stop_codon:yes gene_type:complete